MGRNKLHDVLNFGVLKMYKYFSDSPDRTQSDMVKCLLTALDSKCLEGDWTSFVMKTNIKRTLHPISSLFKCFLKKEYDTAIIGAKRSGISQTYNGE